MVSLFLFDKAPVIFIPMHLPSVCRWEHNSVSSRSLAGGTGRNGLVDRAFGLEPARWLGVHLKSIHHFVLPPSSDLDCGFE